MVHAYTFRLFDYPLSPIHINGGETKKKIKNLKRKKKKTKAMKLYIC